MGVCHSNSKNSQDIPTVREYRPFDQSNVPKRTETYTAVFSEEQATKNPNPFKQEYILSQKIVLKTRSGTYAQCEHYATKEQRLVKIINKESKNSLNAISIIKEIQMLRQLDHPQILKAIEYFDDKTQTYVVFQNFYGNRLSDQISQVKEFTENTVKLIVQQILQTLNYLHSKNIIYRTLSTKTIFMDQDQNVKFIEFSECTQINSEVNGIVGEHGYIAPEQYKGNYSNKVDIWATGVLMYFLLSGHMPFTGQGEEKMKLSILRGNYSLDTNEFNKVTKNGKELLKKLLTFNSDHRIDAATALKHPWITSINKLKQDNAPLMMNSLSNLQRFHQKQDFNQAIQLHLLSITMTDKERDRLKQIFNEIDKNGNGVISKDELTIGFQQYLYPNKKLSKEDKQSINDMVTNLDSNKSQGLDFSEFVLACQESQKQISSEQLNNMFISLDKDHSGTLSLVELRQLFGGPKLKEDTWTQIIMKAKLNGRKTITQQQFMKLIKAFLG